MLLHAMEVDDERKPSELGSAHLRMLVGHRAPCRCNVGAPVAMLVCLTVIVTASNHAAKPASVGGHRSAPPCIARPAVGQVIGKSSMGACVYLGVPYAEAPIGARRFKAPVPHGKWTLPYDATAAGPACPQLGHWAPPYVQRVSEDCLSLNIFSPAAAEEGARLPVLAVVHGGWGSRHSNMDPRIDGTPLARQGEMLVVSLNYRLHILGAMTDLDDPTSPPVRVLDAIAALQWVQRHIAAFGGDPTRVTVLGWSHGGYIVGWLEQLPSAWAYYSRVVRLSSEEPQLEMLPRCHHVDAAGAFAAVAGHVGCHRAALPSAAASLAPRDDTRAGNAMRAAADGQLTAASRACLQSADLVNLTVAAQQHPLSWCFAEARAPAAGGSGKPILHGYVRHDVATAPLLPCIGPECTEERLLRWLQKLTGMSVADAHTAVQLYASVQAPLPVERGGALSGGERFGQRYWQAVEMVRDLEFVCGRREIAHARAAKAPTWFYRFDALTRGMRAGGGVEHGADVSWLFGTHSTGLQEDGAAAAGPACAAAAREAGEPDGSLRASRVPFDVAMRAYLATFIVANVSALLAPQAELQPAGLGLKAWPQWGGEASRPMMLFDHDDAGGAGVRIEPEPTPLTERCEFWVGRAQHGGALTSSASSRG